jgi:Amt family ammonium transporter
MLTATALVLLMTPGLGMFYGGLVRTKNVLGTMMHSFTAMAIVGVLWAVCGYSMAFGTSHGWCGWNWDFFMLSGIDNSVMSAYKIPEYAFVMFQGKFAIITPALIAGRSPSGCVSAATACSSRCGRWSSTTRWPTGSGAGAS